MAQRVTLSHQHLKVVRKRFIHWYFGNNGKEVSRFVHWCTPFSCVIQEHPGCQWFERMYLCVALCVRISVAGANRVEGTMS